MKIIRILVLLLGLLITCASMAQAHAFLDSAVPAVGGKVKSSPTVVKLWFTRHLRPGDTMVQVFNDAKKQVDEGDSKVDKDDPTLLTVSVPKLASGTYTVTWTAVCLVDGHTTHGSFTFDVGDP
jgi:methionine-rich copper-binding protein CopC